MNGKRAKKLRKQVYVDQNLSNREYRFSILKEKEKEIGGRKVRILIGHVIADPSRHIYQMLKRQSA
jgi:hypothetical protein